MTFEGNRTVVAQLTLLDQCCHIWLGSPETGSTMNNLVLSIQTKYDEMPLSRVILQGAEQEDVGKEISGDDWATAISCRMAKRLKMQVMVSSNLPATADFEELLSSIEKNLIAHIESRASQNKNG